MGYDFDPVGEEKHLSTICCQIIKNAVELPCSHAFCEACLNTWEEISGRYCFVETIILNNREKKAKIT